MELRTDKACLQRKIGKLEQDNKSLSDKVVTLDQKCIDDCALIIEQIKSSQKVELFFKKAKATIKKLEAQNELYKKRMKLAKKKFLTMLEVKLQYEHALVDLMKNPSLRDPALQAIGAENLKSKQGIKATKTQMART